LIKTFLVLLSFKNLNWIKIMQNLLISMILIVSCSILFFLLINQCLYVSSFHYAPLESEGENSSSADSKSKWQQMPLFLCWNGFALFKLYLRWAPASHSSLQLLSSVSLLMWICNAKVQIHSSQHNRLDCYTGEFVNGPYVKQIYGVCSFDRMTQRTNKLDSLTPREFLH
jgi:hypothetical protein